MHGATLKIPGILAVLVANSGFEELNTSDDIRQTILFSQKSCKGIKRYWFDGAENLCQIMTSRRT